MKKIAIDAIFQKDITGNIYTLMRVSKLRKSLIGNVYNFDTK